MKRIRCNNSGNDLEGFHVDKMLRVRYGMEKTGTVRAVFTTLKSIVLWFLKRRLERGVGVT